MIKRRKFLQYGGVGAAAVAETGFPACSGSFHMCSRFVGSSGNQSRVPQQHAASLGQFWTMGPGRRGHTFL